jgi:hypothetical protein
VDNTAQLSPHAASEAIGDSSSSDTLSFRGKKYSHLN